MVDKATLLFAASLNFSQVPNGWVLVARSGNTSDFLCSSWKTAIPVCTGPLTGGDVCDCALDDGESGSSPGWLVCARLPAQEIQQTAMANVVRRSSAFEKICKTLTRI